MSLSAAGFTSLATRIVAAQVAAMPATLTFGGSDYDCAIDPGAYSHALEMMGQNPGQSLEVLVAHSEGLTPALDRQVTISGTTTGQLEGVVFLIRAIVQHPNLPAHVLTLERVP
jgi:hypothetical protein